MEGNSVEPRVHDKHPDRGLPASLQLPHVLWTFHSFPAPPAPLQMEGNLWGKQDCIWQRVLSGRHSEWFRTGKSWLTSCELTNLMHTHAIMADSSEPGQRWRDHISAASLFCFRSRSGMCRVYQRTANPYRMQCSSLSLKSVPSLLTLMPRPSSEQLSSVEHRSGGRSSLYSTADFVIQWNFRT